MILSSVPDGCMSQFSVVILWLAVTEIHRAGLCFHSISIHLPGGPTVLIPGLATSLWSVATYTFEGVCTQEQ